MENKNQNSPDKLAQQIIDLVSGTDWYIPLDGLKLERLNKDLGQIEVYEVRSVNFTHHKSTNITLPDRPYEIQQVGPTTFVKST